MRQFLLPEHFNNKKDNIVRITGQKYHYLVSVLRLKKGDKFHGCNKSGGNFQLTIQDIESDYLTLSVIENNFKKIDINTTITLYQCLPKGRKMDLIIRQATETGIKKIVPIISTNTIVKLENKKQMEKKANRWKKISIEALQQSGAGKLPEIDEITNLPNIIADKQDLGIFFHQIDLGGKTLHAYLQNRLEKGNLNNINIVIGPEGGLTEDEIKILIKSGFYPAYLGNTVLRVETAAIFAIAAVKILLLEQEKWKLK